MISFALLLAIGIFSGFLASTPLGPINLLLAHSVLSGRRSSYSAFLTGVIATDVAFAAIAFLGWATFFSDSPIKSEWEIAGGIIIILLGAFFLRKSMSADELEDQEVKGPGSRTSAPTMAGQFIKGVLLCGINPGFIVFWVYVASQIQSHQLSTFAVPEVFLLLIGVALGNVLWFRVFIWILHKGSTRFKHHALQFIRVAISLLLIALGAFTIFNA